MSVDHKQIGEVADRTGLSLRTIRYYEEQGLVRPSARTSGGFRLYTETDIARLMLVNSMKPLDFTLDEMRDILGVMDDLDSADTPAQYRSELIERLAAYESLAQQRRATLRHQLEMADGFAGDLQRELRRQRRGVSVTS